MAKLIDFSSTILNEISSFGQFTFWEKNIKRKAGLVFSIWMQKVAGTSQLLCEE